MEHKIINKRFVVSTNINKLIWCGGDMHINPSNYANVSKSIVIDLSDHVNDADAMVFQAALHSMFPDTPLFNEGS